MINSTPLAVNAIGTEANGRPIYKGRDGKPIYGLKDARAARSYFGAVGGTTQMPNMNNPGFKGYSMGRGWQGQRSQPKGARNEKGDRVVLDKAGNQVPVGNRINARAGNAAVEARDAENRKFFQQAKVDAADETKRVADDARFNTALGVGPGASDQIANGAWRGRSNVAALKQQQAEAAAPAQNGVTPAPVGRLARKDDKQVGYSTHLAPPRQAQPATPYAKAIKKPRQTTAAAY